MGKLELALGIPSPGVQRLRPLPGIRVSADDCVSRAPIGAAQSGSAIGFQNAGEISGMQAIGSFLRGILNT